MGRQRRDQRERNSQGHVQGGQLLLEGWQHRCRNCQPDANEDESCSNGPDHEKACLEGGRLGRWGGIFWILAQRLGDSQILRSYWGVLVNGTGIEGTGARCVGGKRKEKMALMGEVTDNTIR